jgi:hypothetical protein
LGVRNHLADLYVNPGSRHFHPIPEDPKTFGGTLMNQIVEIRSYNLRPGTRAEFHRLFLEEAMPLLQRWNVDVVAYGPSLHDENSYYLMRRFDSLADREESENVFYGSDEWRKGPREAIIALIDTYTEFVLELDDAAVHGLRKA